MFIPHPLVSEAPKEAPVRKYLPSSVYLEEKTDEQKKDEVKRSSNTVYFYFKYFESPKFKYLILIQYVINY